MSKKTRPKKDRKFHAAQSVINKKASSDVRYSTLRKAKKRKRAKWFSVARGRVAVFYKNFWWIIDEDAKIIITVLTVKEFESQRLSLVYQSRSKKRGENLFNNPFREFFQSHGL